MDTLSLHSKIEKLSPELQEEVSHYVDFLFEKAMNGTKNIIPVFGSAKGMVIMADDFDEPLEDFKEYM